MGTGQNPKGRTAARCVARIDLILHFMALIAAIILVVYFLSLQDFKLRGDEIGVVAPLLVILFIRLAVGIWLAVVLLHATDKDVNLDVALRKAKRYRNINIFLTTLAVIADVVEASMLGGFKKSSIILLFIRVIFIYFVQNYIEGIREAQKSLQSVLTEI